MWCKDRGSVCKLKARSLKSAASGQAFDLKKLTLSDKNLIGYESFITPLSRIIGYAVMAFALFVPFVAALLGKVTDSNLLFVKECTKLLMITGALMILFALSKEESAETERIRSNATRNAMFLTFFIFLVA